MKPLSLYQLVQTSRVSSARFSKEEESGKGFRTEECCPIFKAISIVLELFKEVGVGAVL